MKRINITMAEFLLNELDYMAEKRGMNRSQLLSHIVSENWIDFMRSGMVEDYYFEMQEENKANVAI